MAPRSQYQARRMLERISRNRTYVHPAEHIESDLWARRVPRLFGRVFPTREAAAAALAAGELCATPVQTPEEVPDAPTPPSDTLDSLSLPHPDDSGLLFRDIGPSVSLSRGKALGRASAPEGVGVEPAVFGRTGFARTNSDGGPGHGVRVVPLPVDGVVDETGYEGEFGDVPPPVGFEYADAEGEGPIVEVGMPLYGDGAESPEMGWTSDGEAFSRSEYTAYSEDDISVPMQVDFEPEGRRPQPRAVAAFSGVHY